MDFLVNFTHDFLHFSLDCLTELLYFEYGLEDLTPCRSEWLKVVYNGKCLILVGSKAVQPMWIHLGIYGKLL